MGRIHNGKKIKKRVIELVEQGYTQQEAFYIACNEFSDSYASFNSFRRSKSYDKLGR